LSVKREEAGIVEVVAAEESANEFIATEGAGEAVTVIDMVGVVPKFSLPD
jgi:hypothetical protein